MSLLYKTSRILLLFLPTCVHIARTRAREALNRLRNRPELQKTLRLVVKNGNRREDSMWEILASGRCSTWDAAKTLYWTHLKKMLNIFCGQ